MKTKALKLLKAVGIFRFFELINSKKIVVLCYHGVATSDEAEFLPANFISIKKFKNRIQFLLKNKFHFISLEQAIKNIKNNEVSNKSVVVTIDDGFKTIFDEMVPFLLRNNIPTTLYVTTKKSKEDTPIFRLLFQYVLWKTKHSSLDISSIKKINNFAETKIIKKDENMVWRFIHACESKFSDIEREEIILKLATELDVTLTNDLISSFSIADLNTINEFHAEGLDIQLHTHSHNMQLPEEQLEEDILKNQSILSEINKSAGHFCYPSGIHTEENYKLLKKLNIKSATTCKHGLFSSQTDLYQIPRIIDNENMNNIVFESEVNGLMSVLRKLKSLTKKKVSFSFLHTFNFSLLAIVEEISVF